MKFLPAISVAVTFASFFWLGRRLLKSPPAPAVASAQAQAGAGSGRLRGIEDALNRWRAGALNLVAICATAFVIFAIVTDALDGSYAIGPIDVPDSIAKTQIDKDGVAALLKDEVGRVWLESRSTVAIHPVQADTSEPVISVTGTSLPLRYFVNLLRDAFLRPPTHISGEVIPAQKEAGAETAGNPLQVRLVLRTDGDAKGPYFDGQGGFPGVLSDAAKATLAQIDPYAAASALAHGAAADQEKAVRMVRTAEAHARHNEHWRILQWIPYLRSEVPRADLTMANIAYARGDKESARLYFDRANVDYAERSLARSWYAAQDGLAILSIDRATDQRVRKLKYVHYAAAKSYVSNALEQQVDYDSALYHLAQIDDLVSRDVFRDDRAPSTCAARLILERARIEYGHLLELNPDFSVAYSQEAIMLYEEWHWLLDHGRTGCGPNGGAAATRARMASLATAMQGLFEEAQQRDPSLSDPWFQQANYFMDERRRRTGSAKDDMLDAALDRYRRAAALRADDFYIHARYGDALRLRAAEPARAGGADVAGEALRELCLALRLDQSDKDYATTLRTQVALLPGGSCPSSP